MRPDVWIPEATPDEERVRLAGLATLHVMPSGDQIEGSLGHGDFLVVGHHGARRALEVATHIDGLRAIQVFSAGVDSIVGRMPPGIALCNASGVHDVPMAEWVLMAILASFRHLPEHLDAQRSGIWRDDTLEGDDLDGSTVVLVGAGSIGRAVEARLAPFGPEIVRIARRPREGVRAMEDLPGVLPAADVVVILLPLTDETRGVIDARLIGLMRPGALLVGASRGPVIDTDALTAALAEGRIRAAVDVTDPEPLPAGHPLWSAPGLIITPHIGSDVRGDEGRAWQLVFEQVGRLARGEPLVNVVTEAY
jgi:phosphoglycerate dehydrogenase-like enzyme